MLLPIFAPPSGFTQWGLHLCRMLTDVVLKEVDYLNTCEIAKLRELFAARTQPHVFFFADCPDREIVEIFVRTKSHCIVFLEDPRDVAGFIQRERQMSLLWSARLMSQCLMTVAPILNSPNVLVIERGRYRTFRDILYAIAVHFSIALNDDLLPELMDRITYGSGLDADADIEAHFLQSNSHARPIGHLFEGDHASDSSTEAAALELCRLTRAFIEGNEPSKIVWPRQYFIPGDFPNDALHGSIELLGPARCVCFGPYLHLPIGVWEVRIPVRVSENLSGNRIEIDVYHEEVLVAERFRLPSDGRFFASASFEIADPRYPVQFRFILQEGAIEGFLEVGEAQIRRINSVTDLQRITASASDPETAYTS